jgi:hypothetical protein
VDAAGEVAQLVHRACGLGGQAVQLRSQLLCPGRYRRLRGLQRQGERDQPLLGAVVQIPLETPARLVGSRHDPRA